MSLKFEREGVEFQYPETWRLEREDNDDGWTVLVQSPGTAFLTLTCDENMPTTEEMADSALAALREEYPGLEAEERIENVAGQMAIGHDINFISLDLTNTCWTRSIYSDAGTLLMLCQVNDMEQDQYGPVLRAICASLKAEMD